MTPISNKDIVELGKILTLDTQVEQEQMLIDDDESKMGTNSDEVRLNKKRKFTTGYLTELGLNK